MLQLLKLQISKKSISKTIFFYQFQILFKSYQPWGLCDFQPLPPFSQTCGLNLVWGVPETGPLEQNTAEPYGRDIYKF